MGASEPTKGFDGKYVETVQQHELDAKAAMLRARRMTYRDIAKELDVNVATAHRMVQRALAHAGRDTALEARQLMLDHLDQLAQAAWQVLEAQHIMVQQGKVVRLKNEPLRDSQPVLQAIDRLLRIEEQRAKVLGLVVKKVEVITHDAIDAAIQALEKQLEERAAGHLAGESG